MDQAGIERSPGAAAVTAPEVDRISAETGMVPHVLRLILAVEFLLALVATTVVWEEVGGQGHLDLMPWYTKLGLIGGFCWTFVGFSGAIARPGKWRTRRSLMWLGAVIALLVAMGSVTYYYHLHEPADDDDDEDAPAAAYVRPARPQTSPTATLYE